MALLTQQKRLKMLDYPQAIDMGIFRQKTFKEDAHLF